MNDPAPSPPDPQPEPAAAPGAGPQRTACYDEVPVLDLRGASEADIRQIKELDEVGLVIVTESQKGALLGADMDEVGHILTVPEGDTTQVVTRTGQMEMTGDAFTGDPDTAKDQIMVIHGQIMITSSITAVHYKQLHITGQIILPREGAAALHKAVTSLTGQVVLYPEGEVRFLMGKERFGRAFLEMIDQPVCLVVLGKLVFDDDVEPDLLKAKVREVVLLGKIDAPKALSPCLQYLARQNYGKIDAREEG